MQSATTRYHYRPEIRITIDGIDITKKLFGDGGSVRINKSLYAPNGEAQITLPDLPVNDDESGYGYWSPMNPVLIEMRRWREGQTNLEDFYPVFRGVVRSVGRSEQIDSEGRPRRYVHVVAHDCGAFFLMEQLHVFITMQNKDIVTARGLTYIHEYLNGEKIDSLMPVGDFLWDVATKATEPMMKAAGWEFEKKFFVTKGYVMPLDALSHEGPIWSLLDRYVDRPWNEFFTREGKEKTELVFRPAPWFDMDGNPLPDFTDDVYNDLRVFQIPKSDVIALHAHRDDAELVNHVWVNSSVNAALMFAAHIPEAAGIINSETRAKFGDRVQIAVSHLLAGEKPPLNLPESEQKAVEIDMKKWLVERKQWLMQAGEQTHNFERGTMQLKGYASYRVGDYVELARAPKDDALTWQGYVIRTTHDFQAFNRFTVTLEYIRSNQWVNRQRSAKPYWAERQRGETARL
ncbi:MAG: hypothetical protein K9L88_03355 [Chromatiaceae bacterium]|nr:hypothetical protein [Chromatiaceae bacterium]